MGCFHDVSWHFVDNRAEFGDSVKEFKKIDGDESEDKLI